MHVTRIDESQIQITLTNAERAIISNCMNYLCRGKVPRDFHALIGVDVEEAVELLEQLVAV
jgi:hypothetical protein